MNFSVSITFIIIKEILLMFHGVLYAMHQVKAYQIILLLLDWKHKGKYDCPSKKEFLNGVTFLYKSCLSI